MSETLLVSLISNITLAGYIGFWQGRELSDMKDRKLTTVTIAIPALDEEANIVNLLECLSEQDEQGFVVKEIIVRSDGSTDRTAQLVENFADKRIELIDDQHRVGLAASLNQLIDRAGSDILVLVNADVVVRDKSFLAKLIAPILKKQAEVTAPRLETNSPKSFYEMILYVGFLYQKQVFEGLNEGNNWYTCRGALRAMSRGFYKNLRFEHSVGEDMFVYFLSVYSGLKYQFVQGAVAYFRRPGNFADHILQSSRYFNSARFLESKFSREFIRQNYIWPTARFVAVGVKMFLRYPLYAPLYLLLIGVIRIYAVVNRRRTLANKWQMVKSSKSVIGAY